jgi:pimeloyl-ACP methyl ester carboxylesterase
LTLQPGGYFLDPLHFHPLDLGIPLAYITGDDDLAMPRPAAESAARIGVQPIVVPGTHIELLTHPDQVAATILHA